MTAHPSALFLQDAARAHRTAYDRMRDAARALSLRTAVIAERGIPASGHPDDWKDDTRTIADETRRVGRIMQDLAQSMIDLAADCYGDASHQIDFMDAINDGLFQPEKRVMEDAA